jgi:predicted metallopeptidase
LCKTHTAALYKTHMMRALYNTHMRRRSRIYIIRTYTCNTHVSTRICPYTHIYARIYTYMPVYARIHRIHT